MTFSIRFRAAIQAATWHFLFSVLVGVVFAALVFGLWYPHPYSELAGGRELFLLVVIVDVTCGPLLTLVLYNPTKPAAELWRDLSLVAVVQLAALGYGLGIVSAVRPLFLVQEVDRFKVIFASNVEKVALSELPIGLKPKWWTGPTVVAIREPKNEDERKQILFESVQGGRDYAERPDFYLPYVGESAVKSLKRAKSLSVFLQKQSDQQVTAQKLAQNIGSDTSKLFYLPVVARQDWVVVLDNKGMIVGFLKGDGF